MFTRFNSYSRLINRNYLTYSNLKTPNPPIWKNITQGLRFSSTVPLVESKKFPTSKITFQNGKNSEREGSQNYSRLLRKTIPLLVGLGGAITYFKTRKIKTLCDQESFKSSDSIINCNTNPAVPNKVNHLSSLNKEQQTLLLKMLGEELIERVRELPKGTFDPELWRELNTQGPSNYHWIIAKKELSPGSVLWVQEESGDHKLSIYWVTEPGWINRAYPHPSDKKVIIECYMAHAINIQKAKKIVSIEQFRTIVDDHLSKYIYREDIAPQPLAAIKFQRKLEHLPIEIKATQAAIERINQLQADYSNSVIDFYITAGLTPTGKDTVEKMLEISKYFIGGRLLYLSRKQGNPEEVFSQVAPVLRTWEAYYQAKGMILKEEIEPEDGFYQLQAERWVPKITSEEAIKNKSLRDLRAWFVMTPGGFKVEPHEFEKQEVQKTDDEEKLEFHIDYQDEKWEVKSTFYEKS